MSRSRSLMAALLRLGALTLAVISARSDYSSLAVASSSDTERDADPGRRARPDVTPVPPMADTAIDAATFTSLLPRGAREGLATGHPDYSDPAAFPLALGRLDAAGGSCRCSGPWWRLSTPSWPGCTYTCRPWGHPPAGGREARRLSWSWRRHPGISPRRHRSHAAETGRAGRCTTVSYPAFSRGRWPAAGAEPHLTLLGRRIDGRWLRDRPRQRRRELGPGNQLPGPSPAARPAARRGLPGRHPQRHVSTRSLASAAARQPSGTERPPGPDRRAPSTTSVPRAKCNRAPIATAPWRAARQWWRLLGEPNRASLTLCATSRNHPSQVAATRGAEMNNALARGGRDEDVVHAALLSARRAFRDGRLLPGAWLGDPGKP